MNKDLLQSVIDCLLIGSVELAKVGRYTALHPHEKVGELKERTKEIRQQLKENLNAFWEQRFELYRVLDSEKAYLCERILEEGKSVIELLSKQDKDTLWDVNETFMMLLYFFYTDVCHVQELSPFYTSLLSHEEMYEMAMGYFQEYYDTKPLFEEGMGEKS